MKVPAERKIFNIYALIAIILLVLLVCGLLLQSEAWKVGLGIPALLLSGYALVALIFPADDELRLISRILLSLCFSVGILLVAVAIVACITEISGVQLSLPPLIFAISAAGVIFAIIACLRKAGYFYKTQPTEAGFRVPRRNWKNILIQAINAVLILAIISAIGAIVYIVITPHTGEKFTEFYILGMEGKAEGYPDQVHMGEESSLILGVINREHREVRYSYDIVIDKELAEPGEYFSLQHGEKWEQTVNFTAMKAGLNQKVEFVLFKDDTAEPYLTLHIWIDVIRRD